MTSYLISDPAKPWLTLFSSSNLQAVAEALAAQPQPDLSGVYATLDGSPARSPLRSAANYPLT